jgi:hypothetical protein
MLMPLTVIDAIHRLHGVLEQVQRHLLELDPVTCGRRQVVGHFQR